MYQCATKTFGTIEITRLVHPDGVSGRIGNQNQLHLGRRAVLPVNSVFKCDCPDSVAVSSLRGSACIYQLAQPFRAGLNSLPALRADSMHWFTVSVLSERYWASTVPG